MCHRLPEAQPSVIPIIHARWRADRLDMMMHRPHFREMIYGHISVINHNHIVHYSTYRKYFRSGTGNRTWIHPLRFSKNELWKILRLSDTYIQKLSGLGCHWCVFDNWYSSLFPQNWLHMGLYDMRFLIDSHNTYLFVNKHAFFQDFYWRILTSVVYYP